MTYYIKYDIHAICKRLAQEQLCSTGLKYLFLNKNELDFEENVPVGYLDTLNEELRKSGIEILSSQKSIIVQKVKEAINDLIDMEDDLILSKTSHYLAKALNQSYRYLSGIFSELTYTTIENYIIFQKVEKAKEMIKNNQYSFTEIAGKLNYSSIGHFSMQFKNTTGFTPTVFKKIITQKSKNQISYLSK